MVRVRVAALVIGCGLGVGRALQEVPVIVVRISAALIGRADIDTWRDRRDFRFVIIVVMIIIVILFGVGSALDLFNFVDKIVELARAQRVGAVLDSVVLRVRVIRVGRWCGLVVRGCRLDLCDTRNELFGLTVATDTRVRLRVNSVGLGDTEGLQH